MRVCSFPDCARKHESLGYCASHARQLRSGKELTHLRERRLAPVDGLCEFPGCQIKALAKDYCSSHYKQDAKGESLKPVTPSPRLPKGTPWYEEARLKIVPKVKIIDKCLIWHGKIGSTGYPSLTLKGKQWSVHRLVYCMVRNDLDACRGQTVHHICANVRCINPFHLQLATQRENIGEMLARRGYEYTIKQQALEIEILKQTISNLQKETYDIHCKHCRTKRNQP